MLGAVPRKKSTEDKPEKASKHKDTKKRDGETAVRGRFLESTTCRGRFSLLNTLLIKGKTPFGQCCLH